ncbi:hypothetical protein ACQP2E_27645 [Actinoplanes sp. CA-015351]|uniref:hypothetical protein n=1 Tax=Actinoplanes sp. CA-015351 TaxID=3239897 RepID=UPI003D95E6A6
MFTRWAVWATTAAPLTATAGCVSEETAVAAPERGVAGRAMPTKASERGIADGENMVKQFELR